MMREWCSVVDLLRRPRQKKKEGEKEKMPFSIRVFELKNILWSFVFKGCLRSKSR